MHDLAVVIPLLSNGGVNSVAVGRGLCKQRYGKNERLKDDKRDKSA
jgi:hypothetical protein